MLPLVYSESHNLELGAHVFPARKYQGIVERLEKDGFCHRTDLLVPKPATDGDLLLVHTAEYIGKLKQDALSTYERWRLEIPYNLDLFHAMRTAVGGTMLASQQALDHGVAVHIGGGFHHAHPDHGEGFCLLNDVAVAARRLIVDGRVSKAMIVDCDLHHGNGTAAIFHADPNVFTFSIHQEHNYPFEKPPSSLDVGLEDGADDSVYLAALQVVGELCDDLRPGMLFYLAGADPYEEDQLGGLSLTIDGLRRRDRLVIGEARKRRIPIAIVLAGGYARRFNDTILIHTNTILEAAGSLS